MGIVLAGGVNYLRCSGEYNRLLNEQKQYVFPVVRITTENITEGLIVN